MLEKIKNKKTDILIFNILIIINLIVFINIIRVHYSIDTFAIMNIGYKEYAVNIFLKAGRPFSAFITYIAGIFNVSIEVFVTVLVIIAIILSTLSVVILKNKIIKYKGTDTIWKEIIVVIISYITIFNFMYLEIFQFAECPIMALGFLLCIISADIIVERKKHYIIKSLILLIIATFCYQGVMNSFIVFSVLFLLIKNKGQYRYIIKNFLIITILYIIPMIINSLCTKQGRKGSFNNIFLNLKYIIQNIPSIIVNTNYLLPKYFFYIILTGILVILWIYFINGGIKKSVKILEPIFLIIIAFASALIPHLLTLSSFPSGRLMFSIGAIIGILYIYMYTNTSILEKRFFKQILLTILIIYASINIANYYITFMEHQKGRQLDKKESVLINEWIEEYESTSGTKVEKLAFCYDENSTYNHKELINKSSYTGRAMWADISIIGALNFYNDRQLVLTKMSKKYYDNYFKDKNWDNLEKEQLVFEGDTVYYCVY